MLSDIYSNEKVGHIFNHWIDGGDKGKSSDGQLSSDDDFIGVEWEVEGYTDMNAVHIPTLSSKADGTLRDRGRELVFKRPQRGAHALNTINKLYDHGFDKWKLTSFGSTHIHIDVRDLTLHELYKFLAISACLDTTIFSIGNSNYRKESPYCLQSWNNVNWWNDINDLIAHPGEFRDSIREGFGRNRKYSSINLTSLKRFGSIEFRHCRCISDKSVMLELINTLLQAKTLARQAISIEECVERTDAPATAWVKHIVKGTT